MRSIGHRQISIPANLYEKLCVLKSDAAKLNLSSSFGSVIADNLSAAPTLQTLARKLGKTPSATAEALASRYGMEYLQMLEDMRGE